MKSISELSAPAAEAADAEELEELEAQLRLDLPRCHPYLPWLARLGPYALPSDSNAPPRELPDDRLTVDAREASGGTALPIPDDEDGGDCEAENNAGANDSELSEDSFPPAGSATGDQEEEAAGHADPTLTTVSPSEITTRLESASGKIGSRHRLVLGEDIAEAFPEFTVDRNRLQRAGAQASSFLIFRAWFQRLCNRVASSFASQPTGVPRQGWGYWQGLDSLLAPLLQLFDDPEDLPIALACLEGILRRYFTTVCPVPPQASSPGEEVVWEPRTDGMLSLRRNMLFLQQVHSHPTLSHRVGMCDSMWIMPPSSHPSALLLTA